ncbi:ABC transporter permease [Nitriliruptoraceae bacterium ZYF776]|nr:ABC transporter permease [Profundirhabdus halotolerans]
MRDAAALTGRRLRHERRNLDGLLTTVLLPVMMLLVFVYVFGGATWDGRDTYLAYVVPGILVLASAYGASMTAPAVTQDLTTGTVDRLRSMPVSPAALFAGHVGAAVLRTTGSCILVLAVAIGIGLRPTTSPLRWAAALATVAGFALAVSWVAACAGVLARSVEAAGGFTFFALFFPYVSSAFVPTASLPSVLRPVAEHQPVTHVIESLRALLHDQPVGDHAWWALGWCVATVALFVPLTALRFRARVRR